MNINRRTMLAAGGALAAAATLNPKMFAAAPGGKKATYVLVHGGGHGGWCWERVATPLRAAGHLVYAPSMTGLADRSHLLNPSIDLDTQITDIVNLLKWENIHDAIVVGHSYGGMVITGVGDRALDRVGQLVYLDAAHPKNGEPLWSLPATPPAAGAPGGGGRGGGGGVASMAKTVNGVELILFPDKQLINGALGVTDPEDVAWLMDKLTPHPLKCFTQPLRLENEAAVHKIPTTDIWRSMILSNNRKNGSFFTWAERIWEINSPSHDLMITEPKQTTDMLLKLASL